MIRQLVTWAVTTTLIWNGMGVGVANIQSDEVSPVESRKSKEEIEIAITQYLELIAELRQIIDRSQFDTDALLDDLDYDADSILKYVQNEIGFEPYRGLLRGPVGTLMARAGNSLDQSVLLAKLLNNAGFEARIVQGEISEQEINQLLSVVKPGSKPSTPFKDDTAAENIFRRMADIVDMPGSELERQLGQSSPAGAGHSLKTQLHEAAQREASSIISILQENGIKLKNNDGLNRIRHEVREYYWVQYREGTSEWMNLHPAFGSAENPSVDPITYFKGEVPPELQHRVRFQSRLVSIHGTKSKVSPLMDPWERPAANMAQRSVTYSHSPLALPEKAEVPWQYLSSGDIFVPFLDGKIASDNAFDLAGNIIPMMAVQSAGADLIKTVSDKGRLAESALAGLGASDETEKRRYGVSQVQLDITLISPGGEEQSFTRVVYNPCNNHRPIPVNETCFPEEPTVSDKLALTGTTTLAVSVGEFPESFALDRTLERMIGSENLLRLLIDPKKRDDMNQWAQLEVNDMSWLGFLPLFHSFDSSTNPAHIYRPAPSVVLFQQKVHQNDEYSVSLDVLANKKRGLVRKNGDLFNAPEALIYEGVWETGAEYSFLISDFQDAAQRAFPLNRDNDAPNQYKVLSNPESAPDWGRHVMEESMNSGYVVLASSRANADESGRVTWYRVNRSTGETLGMSAEGRGGIVEYMGKLMIGMILIAPMYWAGCLLAGYDSIECLMFARTAGMWAGGAVAFALSVFATILLWPSEAE